MAAQGGAAGGGGGGAGAAAAAAAALPAPQNIFAVRYVPVISDNTDPKYYVSGNIQDRLLGELRLFWEKMTLIQLENFNREDKRKNSSKNLNPFIIRLFDCYLCYSVASDAASVARSLAPGRLQAVAPQRQGSLTVENKTNLRTGKKVEVTVQRPLEEKEHEILHIIQRNENILQTALMFGIVIQRNESSNTYEIIIDTDIASSYLLERGNYDYLCFDSDDYIIEYSDAYPRINSVINARFSRAKLAHQEAGGAGSGAAGRAAVERVLGVLPPAAPAPALPAPSAAGGGGGRNALVALAAAAAPGAAPSSASALALVPAAAAAAAAVAPTLANYIGNPKRSGKKENKISPQITPETLKRLFGPSSPSPIIADAQQFDNMSGLYPGAQDMYIRCLIMAAQIRVEYEANKANKTSPQMARLKEALGEAVTAIGIYGDSKLQTFAGGVADATGKVVETAVKTYGGISGAASVISGAVGKLSAPIREFGFHFGGLIFNTLGEKLAPGGRVNNNSNVSNNEGGGSSAAAARPVTPFGPGRHSQVYSAAAAARAAAAAAAVRNAASRPAAAAAIVRNAAAAPAAAAPAPALPVEPLDGDAVLGAGAAAAGAAAALPVANAAAAPAAASAAASAAAAQEEIPRPGQKRGRGVVAAQDAALKALDAVVAAGDASAAPARDALQAEIAEVKRSKPANAPASVAGGGGSGPAAEGPRQRSNSSNTIEYKEEEEASQSGAAAAGGGGGAPFSLSLSLPPNAAAALAAKKAARNAAAAPASAAPAAPSTNSAAAGGGSVMSSEGGRRRLRRRTMKRKQNKKRKTNRRRKY